LSFTEGIDDEELPKIKVSKISFSNKALDQSGYRMVGFVVFCDSDNFSTMVFHGEFVFSPLLLFF
jgi:hypothetical protein